MSTELVEIYKIECYKGTRLYQSKKQYELSLKRFQDYDKFGETNGYKLFVDETGLFEWELIYYRPRR